MRYIKTYEKLESQYTIDDFLNIKYWRYRNRAGINAIFRIDSTKEVSDDINFNLTILNLDSNLFGNQTFGLFMIRGIISSKEYSEKILRPATQDEIEDFELMYKTTKYNL